MSINSLDFDGIFSDFFRQEPYSDGSDSYAINHNYIIYFTHVATGARVNFKAFITDFEDQYSSNWNDQAVYGRMDPISTFQGTTRQISFSFDVVAASLEEAKSNWRNSRMLTKFLYPVYEVSPGHRTSATSLQAPPLLKIRFANLIDNNNDPNELGGTGALVGKLQGLSYRPDFDAGVFDGVGKLLPKVNKFSCNFTVFHTADMSWFSRPGSEVSNEAKTEPGAAGGAAGDTDASTAPAGGPDDSEIQAADAQLQLSGLLEAVDENQILGTGMRSSDFNLGGFDLGGSGIEEQLILGGSPTEHSISQPGSTSILPENVG